MENFKYQRERKVFHFLRLNSKQAISIFTTFASASELKSGLNTRERRANRRQYPLL